MGSPILQLGCTLMCPHGGQVLAVPSQTRVQAGGTPALLAADASTIVGCPFTVGPKYQPCVTVMWQALATRVAVNQQPPLLESSVGMCKSAEGAVQGVLQKSGVQTKVKGQ